MILTLTAANLESHRPEKFKEFKSAVLAEHPTAVVERLYYDTEYAVGVTAPSGRRCGFRCETGLSEPNETLIPNMLERISRWLTEDGMKAD